jgi:hypothetical protein
MGLDVPVATRHAAATSKDVVSCIFISLVVVVEVEEE